MDARGPSSDVSLAVGATSSGHYSPRAGTSDAMRYANDSEFPVFDPYSTYIGLSAAVPDAGATVFEAAGAFSASRLTKGTDRRDGAGWRGSRSGSRSCAA